MIIGKCLKCNGKINHHNETIIVKCVECGIREKAQIICADGHYYCNVCASSRVVDKIYELLDKLDGKNPVDNAEILLAKCGISGNSPHPLTTAAFLIAYKNLTQKITYEDIINGVTKATQIPGGWCGYYGNCGAAVGLGLSFAIINKSTPIHDKERSIANMVTSEGLVIVAEQGGPRCCIGSVRGVLEISEILAEKYLDIKFPERKQKTIKCWQSQYNSECKKERCLYYNNIERAVI